MSFEFLPLAIPEVLLIQNRVFDDERGYFMMSFRKSVFSANGISEDFVQDNVSFSLRHVLRGLHYQKAPYAQGKLVMVLQGEVFDVAVDIRRQSPTYGQWVGRTLAGGTGTMMYIPPGFAHGFCVLSEKALFSYKVTAEYAPETERGIRWDDPEIGIEWPVEEPLLSPKDCEAPGLRDADHDF
jgi:dTDP-4-dehydrorhamnose 3,5-epimerase